MGGIFDGSSFVGLDQDIAGDGTTDSSTQFLDTYLENRLDGNARYLLQRGGSASRTWQQDGTKVYVGTLHEAVTLIHFAVPVRPNLSEIKLFMRGEVDEDSGNVSTPEIDARLELRSFRKLATESANLRNTTQWQGTGSQDEYTVTLDLSGENLDFGIGYLTFAVRSNKKDDFATSVYDSFGTRIDIDDSGNNVSSGNFDAGTSLEVKWIKNEESFSSFIGLHEKTSGSSVLVGHTNSFFITSDAGSTTDDMKVRSLCYLQPTAAHIRFTYDDTTAQSTSVKGWSDKSDRSMLPQNPVLGEDTAMHGPNIDEIKKRRRLKAIGPTSKGPSEGIDWPTNESQDWRYTDHANAAPHTLDLASMRLDADSSTVICHMTLAGLRDFGTTPNIGGEYDISSSDFDDLTDIRADRGFDVKIAVEQLSSGDDWSTATTVASETTEVSGMPYWPMGPSKWPLISQMYFSRYPVAQSSRETDFRYTHKEGMLFDRDFQLIHPIRVAVDIDSISDKTKPVRIKTTYETTNNTTRRGTANEETFYTLTLGSAYYEEATL